MTGYSDTQLTGTLSSEIRQISLQLPESLEFSGSDRGQSLISAETKHLRLCSSTHCGRSSLVCLTKPHQPETVKVNQDWIQAATSGSGPGSVPINRSGDHVCFNI